MCLTRFPFSAQCPHSTTFPTTPTYDLSIILTFPNILNISAFFVVFQSISLFLVFFVVPLPLSFTEPAVCTYKIKQRLKYTTLSVILVLLLLLLPLTLSLFLSLSLNSSILVVSLYTISQRRWANGEKYFWQFLLNLPVKFEHSRAEIHQALPSQSFVKFFIGKGPLH